MLRAFGHRVATCCEVLGVVGSDLTLFNLEPTTPNMSQHIATWWPNARNMLCPTMLRYVGLACCDRLAGALRTSTATIFYRFKLVVTRIQINLGDSCQLTRNSFKYNFLSQCFSRDTNLSYFHDRQLLRFGRHFEQVCFERDSREDFAKRAIQSFLIWAKIRRVIFIGRE